MNVEIKQLKDTLTGEVFVPLTHWDAVANKPEDIAKETTVQEINNKLNGVAQESTSQEILEEVQNIDIDTTDLAKQGSNAEATLTAIYEALKGSEEPSQDIPEGVAERLALILEFFGIKTLDGYEFMTEQEVYDELEVIMTTMDGDLTAEMAASITAETKTIMNQ